MVLTASVNSASALSAQRPVPKEDLQKPLGAYQMIERSFQTPMKES